MKGRFYYSNDNGATWEGPLTADEVEVLKAAGVISPTSLVKSESEPAAAPQAGAAPVPPTPPTPGAPAAAPAAEYYLLHNGVQSGPFTVEGLRTMMRQGLAAPQDKVWKEGMPAWEDISKILPTDAEGDSLPSIKAFSLSKFFSTAFKHHKTAEAEELFCAGTAKGTPMLAQVQEDCPAPWFFLRVMLFSLVLFFGFDMALNHYANLKLIPGWEFVGAFGFPLCLLILFFEMNVRKDTSVYRCLFMFLGGGLMSMVFALALFDAVESSHAYIAGFVEEPAKLMAAVFVAGALRNGRILTGMLLGAAVGAGFAAFETAGYINDELLISIRHFSASQTLEELCRLDNVLTPELKQALHQVALNMAEESSMHVDFSKAIVKIRAIGTIVAGHTQWTAITAGAYWYVMNLKRKEHVLREDSGDFALPVLTDFRFLKIAIVPVLVHAFWNSDFLRGSDGERYIKMAICGCVTWFFVIKLMVAGLRQIREEKIAKGFTILNK